MPFHLDHLGTWSQEFEFKVAADHTRAYADATNDPIAEHLDGTVAPPNFAVVPLFNTEVMAEAGNRVIALAPEERLRVLHGQQDLIIHQPIRPGMLLRVRGTTIGVHAKRTGTTVTQRIETTDDEGARVNTQYVTTFYRGVFAGVSGGQQAPGHSIPAHITAHEPTATLTQRFDDDQTHRYATASGDHLAIHLDDQVAKSVGLPGIIVHGLCTMAFAAHGVIGAIAGGDASRLARVAVRFSNLAFPGQEIATRIWEGSAQDGMETYHFETVNPDRQPVLSQGLARIR